MQNFSSLISFSGLPDGGSLENGFSLFERRTGRRSRRQKGAARSNEGKPQSLSSEKENIEVDPLRSLEESHGELISYFIVIIINMFLLDQLIL